MVVDCSVLLKIEISELLTGSARETQARVRAEK
jgi:hypothetical protein